MVKQAFAFAFADYDVQITNEETYSIKDRITSGNAVCAFVMTGSTSYTYYFDNLSMYGMNTEIANEVWDNFIK